ncbi:winged helix-turn-helix transcriptional regulator [Xenorhabdus sp. Reich]|uniref:Winged helix-turn-helix transcriptional regulator n=1 Tax=Xenorhabdus littoralis TaxID=2582835 RepID=A0ABU4SIZ8_9GAMM|nr:MULTISPECIES: MarR family winged helix-turn-helix transcriptional regulator [unclassified Xenorhabdus]MDX7990739.1 winged helix-turn-helix transcriptional regulator [Xenorhabdus sp. psl]MDX7998634.1 winged helix-turn-helix transcriptional regulator [Xenorhabdus sp. Reich]
MKNSVKQRSEPNNSTTDDLSSRTSNTSATKFYPEYDTFCCLLQRAARLWRREANHELRNFRLSESITGPIWAISKFGSMRQKELAEHVGIEGNSLVRILDELEEEGLVVRRSMPGDRRARLIELTAAGRRVAVELEQVLRGFISSLLGNTDPADVQATQRVLTEIINEANRRVEKD